VAPGQLSSIITFAKSLDGEFHLRIEDTDRIRSTKEATNAIIEGLNWLEIKHDGEIVFQSANEEHHIKAAHKLLETQFAYKCYASTEELEALRTEALKTGKSFRSPYRDKKSEQNKPYTIRFRVPDGNTQIKDLVQGSINWDNTNFDDFVLLRADGTPTYMLAVVVDDHNMNITHVVRGDDHLINAGRQAMVYQALGWTIPTWAHLSLIHGPDGKKLSKRHGALSVQEYRDMGYLPSGLRNYLLKLGWAHGNDELFFDEQSITKVFSMKGVNSAPARLDFDKMDYINGQHIMRENDETLLTLLTKIIKSKNEYKLNDTLKKRLLGAMPSLKSRSKNLIDLADQAEYLLLSRPLNFTEKNKRSFHKNGALEHLSALTFKLKCLEEPEWNKDNIQQVIESYLEVKNIGFGRLGQPVRMALTGGRPSPDLSLVLYYLGKSETLLRLQNITDEYKDLIEE
jgi:glutamyl-tRNA synthetase